MPNLIFEPSVGIVPFVLRHTPHCTLTLIYDLLPGQGVELLLPHHYINTTSETSSWPGLPSSSLCMLTIWIGIHIGIAILDILLDG